MKGFNPKKKLWRDDNWCENVKCEYKHFLINMCAPSKLSVSVVSVSVSMFHRLQEQQQRIYDSYQTKCVRSQMDFVLPRWQMQKNFSEVRSVFS